MQYEGVVYRPPSEARSLIIQVTIGCAHNRCTFCSMYKEKHFRIRAITDVLGDLKNSRELYGKQIEKIFFADGDALVVPTKDLLLLLSFIKKEMPWVKQVASYAAPRDLLIKSAEELKELSNAGLSLLYIGAESGSDQVLTQIQKGATRADLIEACTKAKLCGFRTSVTLISGLGSAKLFEEHARDSASLISAIKPDYLGFLTLMLEKPAPIVKLVQDGSFPLLSPDQVMEEMEIFLNEVDSEGTVFRSNHASNYVMLKGTLNKDREALLHTVIEARKQVSYRKETWRRL